MAETLENDLYPQNTATNSSVQEVMVRPKIAVPIAEISQRRAEPSPTMVVRKSDVSNSSISVFDFINSLPQDADVATDPSPNHVYSSLPS